MKSAEEERFVTGGRPSSHMRVAMPAVETAHPRATSPQAETLAGSGPLSQESTAQRKAQRDRIMAAEKVWAAGKTGASLALRTCGPKRFSMPDPDIGTMGAK